MEVTGQLRASAALPRGNSRSFSLERMFDVVSDTFQYSDNELIKWLSN